METIRTPVRSQKLQHMQVERKLTWGNDVLHQCMTFIFNATYVLKLMFCGKSFCPICPHPLLPRPVLQLRLTEALIPQSYGIDRTEGGVFLPETCRSSSSPCRTRIPFLVLWNVLSIQDYKGEHRKQHLLRAQLKSDPKFRTTALLVLRY